MPVRNALFISYRRGDTSAFAGRIRDRLNTMFPGRVFMDVTDIEIGQDFIEVIKETLACCTVVVAVIGPKWRETGEGKPFGGPDDYVALELGLALEQELPIVPVLVAGVPMPSAAELPEHLAPLARLNAFEIRHSRFDQDLGEFTDELYRQLHVRPPSRVETWFAMMTGLRQFNEFQRGMYSFVVAFMGVIALLAAFLTETQEDLPAVFVFPIMGAMFWVMGKNSFKLGWLAHTGWAATWIALVIAGGRLFFSTS
jgi:hypothetical protein